MNSCGRMCGCPTPATWEELPAEEPLGGSKGLSLSPRCPHGTRATQDGEGGLIRGVTHTHGVCTAQALQEPRPQSGSLGGRSR